MSSFEILILSPDEDLICFLNSEETEIEETNEESKIRNISITHPIQDDNQEYRNWFKMGNKIFIPESNVTHPCLYVINTEYQIDYWKENTITVEAEEILVELNNSDLFYYTDDDPIRVVPETEPPSQSTYDEVRKTNLYDWFGKHYAIGRVEYPNPTSNDGLKFIHPCGSMTKMELMNLIEEETGNKFITWYYLDDDGQTIKRSLDFLRPQNVGITHKSILDVGYNSDNMELIVDETDVFKAIAPVFSISNEPERGTTTSTVSETRFDMKQVIETGVLMENDWIEGNPYPDGNPGWVDFEVQKGDLIPMIAEKFTETTEETVGETTTQTQTEKIRYISFWNAPFSKQKGEMFIYDEDDTKTEYNQVKPRTDLPHTSSGTEENDVLPPSDYDATPKIGTISTNETDVYAIYKACADELINKRYPEVEVDVEAHDLNQIMNESDGYSVHDKIYIKMPGYNELLRGKINKTVKNPHDPGKSKITINNIDTGFKIIQNETYFVVEDHRVLEGAGEYFEAELRSRIVENGDLIDDIPVNNALVSLTVIKPAEQITNTTLTTTTETTETTGSGDTITIQAKPTCAFKCGSWKYYTTTFLNKCCFCGKTLRINPKQADGSELTCSACGADFCGVCGRDKMWNTRCSLTKAAEQQSVTVETKTETAIESVDSIMKEARSIRYQTPSCSPKCDNVDEGYECVKSRRVADCFGMSAYLYRRLNDAGHKTRIVVYYSSRASSGTHRTVQVYQNNQWVDPNYSGFDTRFKNMSTKKNMSVCKDAPETSGEGNTKEQSTTTTIPEYKKTYTRITDENGKFRLQINLRATDYQVLLNYGGDVTNASSTSTVNLIVM